MNHKVLLIVSAVLFSQPVVGEISVPGGWVWTPDKQKLTSEPPMWKEMRETAPEPLVSLDSVELTQPDKLNELRNWNRQRVIPTKNGISHEFENQAHINFIPVTANLESGSKHLKIDADQHGQTIETADGDLVWSTSVVVDDSYRLRLRLENVDLLEGVQMWVHSNEDENIGPFGAELVDDEGSLWTPSVSGPELTLVVLVPEEDVGASFTVTQIAEMFRLDSVGQPLLSQNQESHLSCMEDAQCISDSTYKWIDETSTSVAMITYMEDGASYQCSGGLISDTDDDTQIPYFLTANHCISTQSAASSLEAYWDFIPPFCGASPPTLNSVPRTNGASLLATGEDGDGDFTLLRLSNFPGGRWMMGFNTSESEFSLGTTLHKISHPAGEAQSYLQTVVDGGTAWCTDWPRDSFIYQSQIIGGGAGGSSGAPVLNSQGQVIGQTAGRCGENYETECNPDLLIVDGAMRTYWSKVQPYLAPQDATPADLAITILDAENGTYAPGDLLTIEYKVQNIGGLDSASYTITFYASTNTTITSSDRVLGFLSNGVLGPGDSHHFDAFGPVPTGIPDGNYYIGAILSISDANSSNNTKYDTTRITIEKVVPFMINPGLNGSWFNSSTNGQGFLIDVLPNSGVVFLAWFTYDTSRPPSSYLANLGEPGHRWLTAQGGFNGDTAQLNIVMSEGGVFDKGSPAPVNSAYGTITIVFHGCNSATITYSIPGIATNKVIRIERIVTDNVGLCETLNSQLQSTQSSSNSDKEDVLNQQRWVRPRTVHR